MSENKKVIQCDCISKAEEGIRKKTGDPSAYICHAHFTINGSLNSLPKISVKYRIKCANGFLKKPVETIIIPRFCPFCGKQYNISEAPPGDA
jgi:hypothetical protein